MTWQTPDGNRWLTGAEATLVRRSLASMVDRLSEEVQRPDRDLSNYGVYLFDELTATQRITVLKQVAKYLLTETADTPELSAVNEAAVYAVFRAVMNEIESEVDLGPLSRSEGYGSSLSRSEGYGGEAPVDWRAIALEAYNECFPEASETAWDPDIDWDDEDAWQPPNAECALLSEWEFLVEGLADRILWDRDFEMAGEFLDTEPAQAAAMKQFMGIETNYYTEIADETRADRVEQELDSLRQLTRQKPR